LPACAKASGQKDASITLRYYAHWLPDASRGNFVDALDDTSPNVTHASPAAWAGDDQIALSAFNGAVSLVGIEHVWRARRATPTCLRITGRNHIEQREMW
jgi:hypothetical protein